MQTLKRRTSPCKYKNDPSRFLGEGITFKAKLIGILEVSEARGDKMCQDALNDLKTAIRAAGEHKQRITINISIDGLRLRDEKTGDCLYHHPVHKISFIAQDMSDSRAFGYIFGSPDTGHRFFGIKTDKTASQVVISMRDLFQVVFELKKKEIEMAKHHSDQHHVKYGSTGYMDSIHLSKDDGEFDKGKGKYSQPLKSRGLTSKSGEAASSDGKAAASEAVADLLDLDQGLSQIDRITSSDPFGSISLRNDPYDPFDDSFSLTTHKSCAERKIPIGPMMDQHAEEVADLEKQSSFFAPTASTSKAIFFQQFSPGLGKSKMDEIGWFERETDSLFDDAINVTSVEASSSPIALSTPAPVLESEQGDGKKSPIKTDLFTELDPLGTGRVKPYIDKKDFFQDLKNPPKKVLKEMISDGSAPDSVSSLYFATHFSKDKTSVGKSDPAPLTSAAADFKESNLQMQRIDPFNDGDPFEKTDPFQEENFSMSVGFQPLFGAKSSLDEIFDEKPPWKIEKITSRDAQEENLSKKSPTNFPLLSSGTLRVSLPPEKPETTTSVGQLSIADSVAATAKFKSPPKSPDDLKSTTRRKYYPNFPEKTLEDEVSPVREEPFIKCKLSSFDAKIEPSRRSPFKEKFFSIPSPPPSARTEKVQRKGYSGVEILDATTPDPPPRAKTALFSIKPPPLPPKKTNQPVLKPPARPPSLDDQASHYDYLQKKDTFTSDFQPKEELKCMKLKKQLFTGREVSPSKDGKRQSLESGFPVFIPPPTRKSFSDGGKTQAGKRQDEKITNATPTGDGSVLNLKLTQLDSSSLESLAASLGIPAENIYSMTLQDLTKMLAEKYLPTTTEQVVNSVTDSSFEVDFESNFADPNATKPNPIYDKYAVFKELIENEKKVSDPLANDIQGEKEDHVVKGKEANESGHEEVAEREEDKYEALRQLSLNAHNVDELNKEDENFGEPEIALSTNSREQENLFSSPLKFETSGGEDVDTQIKRPPLEPLEDKTGNQVTGWASKSDWKASEMESGKEADFSTESQLFPLVDQFSDEKKPYSPRDKWATFEKSDFHETGRRSLDAFNETENSPISSDGKEDEREIPFRWHHDMLRKKEGKKDVPWHDDDESWDDYSPKESLYSDESSHEDRSPEARRDTREKKPWNVRGRPSKDRNWSEKTGHWGRMRSKWQDETEDEFEDTWRKQRERTGSYDSDRKNLWQGNNYEEYGKRYERCNNWRDDWEEGERHQHSYGSRRKRSESDNEYRKRCDSDTSEKECIWTFQKNFSEPQGKIGKQKQYHSLVRFFRDCPKHCHESRSKHRKGTSQKRPSSASESKRNYDKICHSSDYPCKGGDQTYSGKRHGDPDEFSRYQQHGCKDFRHREDAEFGRYYSYDRKALAHQTKQGSASFNAGDSNSFGSTGKRGESEDHAEYADAYSDKKYKYSKPEFDRSHFQFDSEVENFDGQNQNTSNQSVEPSPKLPDTKNQWASANGKTEEAFLPMREDNGSFVDFKREYKMSPNKTIGSRTEATTAEQARDVDRAQETKTRNHEGKMATARQESSSLLRKSDSINIFSRDKDPFEGDDFFSNVS